MGPVRPDETMGLMRPKEPTRLEEPMRLKKPSLANEARPRRPTRMKRPSPADKVDEANGASVVDEALEAVGARANKAEEAVTVRRGR